MDEKRSRELHGRVFIDFAKNVSTDETALTYFKNIANLFNFSPGELSKILECFPNSRMFKESVGDLGIELIKLTRKKRIVEYALAEQYSHEATYDQDKRCFWLIEYDLKQCGEEEDYYHIDYVKRPKREISFDELKLYLESNSDPHRIPSKMIFESMQDSITLGNRIAEIKCNLPSYDEIIAKGDYYSVLENEHHQIEITKESLRTFLSQLVDKQLSESQLLKRMLIRFNHLHHIDFEHYEITSVTPFNVDYFLQRTENHFMNFYVDPISYCVIKFLSNAENHKFVKLCEFCKDYYLANKMIPGQAFCSEKCRNDHKNRKKTKDEISKAVAQSRANKADAKLKKEMESRYKYLIQQGWKEKEAKGIIQGEIEEIRVRRRKRKPANRRKTEN